MTRSAAICSLGWRRQPAIRRMLALAGWQLTPPWRQADAVAVWGRGRVARRGAWLARRRGAPLLSVEDGFLRSIRPGPGEPPLSLLLDDLGVHFDADRPSRLERMLLAEDLSPDLARAEAGMAFLRRRRLSKYNAEAPLAAPPQGHVLVLDQCRGDAALMGAGRETFDRMLFAARAEHPGTEILIRAHPGGWGHYGPDDMRGPVRLHDGPGGIHDLAGGARAVYAVSSLAGFEALVMGRELRLFGRPFYAGWGASEDEIATPRRSARRSVAEIFAAAYLRYPIYFDPFADRLCDFERAAALLDARVAAYRANAGGRVCVAMARWKRRHMRAFLDGPGPAPTFVSDPARAVRLAARSGRAVTVWAGREPPDLAADCARAGVRLERVEDGFLRSIGLGAGLTPPASLILDDRGMHFDPARPSRIEAALNRPPPPRALARAAALRRMIVAAGLTKYGETARSDAGRFAEIDPDSPNRRRILVVGQVADDASLRLGGGKIADNAALLRAARAAHPDAWILYRPHPDVIAGLRAGALPTSAAALADAIDGRMPLPAALARVDRVWTMTSLAGFEALLRGVPVTTLGAPFYAGWGLTAHRGPPLPRRCARPSIDHLVWAALIDAPRCLDPVTGLRCSPETLARRLAQGSAPGKLRLALLARAQAAIAAMGLLRAWRPGPRALARQGGAPDSPSL